MKDIQRSANIVSVATLFVLAGLIALTGCNTSESGQAAKTPKRKLKFKFHKPKSLPKAVERMRELHSAVVSEDAMPDPITYEVEEEVHGTGSAGHSHYHLVLADEEESDDDKQSDSDGHETTATKIHHVEVDSFTELTDIARWLPAIAADGEMEEATWNQVKSSAEQFSEQLDDSIGEVSDVEAKRGAYKNDAKKFADVIAQLETLVH